MVDKVSARVVRRTNDEVNEEDARCLAGCVRHCRVLDLLGHRVDDGPRPEAVGLLEDAAVPLRLDVEPRQGRRVDAERVEARKEDGERAVRLEGVECEAVHVGDVGPLADAHALPHEELRRVRLTLAR